MAKFNVGQTIRTTGTNEQVTVKSIRSNKGHTWYVLDNGETLHERYLWDGIEKKAFCSQLICQRPIDLVNEIEGTNYTKDEYGFWMCYIHLEE